MGTGVHAPAEKEGEGGTLWYSYTDRGHGICAVNYELFLLDCEDLVSFPRLGLIDRSRVKFYLIFYFLYSMESD